MVKKTAMKGASKKAKKETVDRHEARERSTVESVMQTVLAQSKADEEVVRLDQWVPIECPHCGEGTELHVIADMDGQSVDQDCAVCCRPYVAHIEIEEDEANVSVEAS